MTSVEVTLEEELEEVSFRNRVHFYREGLERVRRGELSQDIFTPQERRLMNKHGVLTRKGRNNNFPAYLTPRALEVLEKTDE